MCMAEMGAPPAIELINDTSFREFMLSYCPEDSVWIMRQCEIKDIKLYQVRIKIIAPGWY